MAARPVVAVCLLFAGVDREAFLGEVSRELAETFVGDLDRFVGDVDRFTGDLADGFDRFVGDLLRLLLGVRVDRFGETADRVTGATSFSGRGTLPNWDKNKTEDTTVANSASPCGVPTEGGIFYWNVWMSAFHIARYADYSLAEARRRPRCIPFAQGSLFQPETK